MKKMLGTVAFTTTRSLPSRFWEGILGACDKMGWFARAEHYIPYLMSELELYRRRYAKKARQRPSFRSLPAGRQVQRRNPLMKLQSNIRDLKIFAAAITVITHVSAVKLFVIMMCSKCELVR